MSKVFLDTNFLVALELSTDQHHATAKKHWESLSGKLPPLVTTSFIVDEAVTFFSSRSHHAKAVKIGHFLLDSSILELIHVEESLSTTVGITFNDTTTSDTR